MSAPTVLVRRIGREGEPVAIIDHFSADPDALRAQAQQQAYAPAGRHYPGIAAPVPDGYVRDQGRLIATVLREVFGISGRISVLETRFSMVTAVAEALTLEQRLPHVDALEPGRLALIHYLAPDRSDGTAFYRHRCTGFETVDAARSEAYFAALDRDLRTDPPSGYINGDTPLFERTAIIPAAYNRALLYRGRLLHSGAIPAGASLPSDPATGRLTITGFFAS